MWQHSKTICDISMNYLSQQGVLSSFDAWTLLLQLQNWKDSPPSLYCHTMYLVLLSMYLLCNVILNLFIAFVVTKTKKPRISKIHYIISSQLLVSWKNLYFGKRMNAFWVIFKMKPLHFHECFKHVVMYKKIKRKCNILDDKILKRPWIEYSGLVPNLW